ncbi:response regulator rcp1 [Geobacter sp. OR-1]|uniref:response regulator n=1 Tax=Geobacter sp. OR-1 TaxID=1266765 RepID=UPI0005443B4F|nr:response regulator [Geobacter sp. OR-1]GAM09135.1 response regulator rcp1 [Geobacter sp. OR-1]
MDISYSFNVNDQMKSKGRTILLAEDNLDDAFLTQRALKKANIINAIYWVKDGVEAVDYLFRKCLDRREKLPNLVLLDIHMPRLNGIEVLQRIRSDERTRLLPVVIFSSSSQESDRIESYRLGVNSYIQKPIDFNQFEQMVSLIGYYWMLLNHGPIQKF